MADISHLGRDHICFCASRKIEELIELMRSYISNNPSEIFLVKKPIRAGRGVHSMRPQPYGLDDLSNSAFLHQFPCFNSSAVFKPFAVHNGIDPSGLLLYPTDFFKLFKAGDTWLICHIILAVLHHPDAQWSPLVRYDRAEHQVDGFIF